ncbi:hypothetical protein ACETU7_12875 [Rhodococcus sp. 3Y1]
MIALDRDAAATTLAAGVGRASKITCSCWVRVLSDVVTNATTAPAARICGALSATDSLGVSGWGVWAGCVRADGQDVDDVPAAQHVRDGRIGQSDGDDAGVVGSYRQPGQPWAENAHVGDGFSGANRAGNGSPDYQVGIGDNSFGKLFRVDLASRHPNPQSPAPE